MRSSLAVAPVQRFVLCRAVNTNSDKPPHVVGLINRCGVLRIKTKANTQFRYDLTRYLYALMNRNKAEVLETYYVCSWREVNGIATVTAGRQLPFQTRTRDGDTRAGDI